MPLAASLNLNDGGFTWYVIGLVACGLVQLVIAYFGFGSTRMTRIISTLFGVVFLGYGIYLALFFVSGNYRFFPYAFVVPVFFIVNIVRLRAERQRVQDGS